MVPKGARKRRERKSDIHRKIEAKRDIERLS